VSVRGPMEEGSGKKILLILWLWTVEEDMWARLIPSERPGREGGLSCPIVVFLFNPLSSFAIFFPS
jgi:hypothetical protein